MSAPHQKVGQPYRTWKHSGSFDAIVIGSGIGGLTAAAILAKRAGQRVLVLERHYTAGGFTHVFHRPGFEWDVGLHYVGQMQAGEELRAVFDYISEGRVRWASVGDVYDRILLPSGSYDLVAGKDRFRQELSSKFPGEKQAIDRYLRLLAGCYIAARPYLIEKSLSPILSLLVGKILRYPCLRYARNTTKQVLEELTSNPELRGVLAGQWYDYGLPPAQSSFAMHAILAHHYLEGASYPVGGAGQVARGIVPTIQAAGGELIVAAEVAEILVENGAAVGIRMTDGEEIRSPLVISDAGVHNTLGRLIPKPVQARLGQDPAMESLPASLAHLNLYVGLPRSDLELGLGRANLWVYPSPDHDRNVAAYVEDPQAPLPLVWICFSSAKDPTFAERFPGHATLQLMSFARYEQFRQWEGSQWHRRGEAYQAIKVDLTQRLLEALYRHVPQVRGHVAFHELATPLSTRHFANYAKGEIYGLAAAPARFGLARLRPRTAIRGLYLTGQDVAVSGMAGAMLGGALCAASLLGVKSYLGIVKAGRRFS